MSLFKMTPFSYLIGAMIAIMMILDPSGASAGPLDGVEGANSGDGIQELIRYINNGVIALLALVGALAVLTGVAGLIMILPIVGKPEVGKSWLKIAAWVIVGAGAFGAFIALMNGIFN